jgi:ABC-type cobalamin transport system permease subunit
MISLISILIFTLITWAVYTGKELQFAIIHGFMVGALYDVDQEEEVNYHTIQLLIGVLSINILWES